MFRLILNETFINSLNTNVSPFFHAFSLSQVANQIINPQENPSLPLTVFQFSKQNSLSLSLTQSPHRCLSLSYPPSHTPAAKWIVKYPLLHFWQWMEKQSLYVITYYTRINSPPHSFSFFSKILFYLMVGIKSFFFFYNSYSKAIAHGVMA